MTTKILNIIFGLLMCGSLSGCSRRIIKNATLVPEISPLNTQIELRVTSDTSSSIYEGIIRKRLVSTFYRDTNGSPVWIKENKLSHEGDSIINFLNQLDYYGLPRDRYHVKEIESYHDDISETTLIRTDVLLTDAFLAVTHDIGFGLQAVPSSGSDSIAVDLLRNAIADGHVKKWLEWQEPKSVGYRSLKRALKNVLDFSSGDTAADADEIPSVFKVICADLERWRNESVEFNGQYLFINIPSYMLYLVNDSDTLLTSRVIVGNVASPTPELNSIIECFTIYPYWHVPRKIAIEEYLSIIQQDTSFISRNNFDVLDRKGGILNPANIEWKKFTKNYFPISLRQREGPENALGVIKFHFDNPYAVYLHDTNSKRLFRIKDRALSHGCIRVEKAEDLAHFLATGRLGEKSNVVKKKLNEKKQSVINAAKPLPIYIRYFTTEVINGHLIVYKDVYGKDERLLNILFPSKTKSSF